MFFWYIVSLLCAILSIIPSIYSISTAGGTVALDDKKLSDNAYKIEAVSVTDVAQRIQNVPKFDPEQYK